jgi:hypothetical protein
VQGPAARGSTSTSTNEAEDGYKNDVQNSIHIKYARVKNLDLVK